MLRTLRNIVLSIIVLLIIFIGGGVAYLLLAGNDAPPQPTTPPANVAPQTNLPKPHKPAPNAPVGVSIQSLITPVAPGENSTVTIKTLSSAACTITVTYNNVASKDSGLIPKVADDYGIASWSWTVDKTAPAGKWPVKVTCEYNKKSGMAIGDLEIKK
jgi:hypothetical protein